MPTQQTEPQPNLRAARVRTLLAWLTGLGLRHAPWSLALLTAAIFTESLLRPLTLFVSRAVVDHVAALITGSAGSGAVSLAAVPALPPDLTPIWWLLAALLLIRIAQSAARALQPLASHLANESLGRVLTMQVLRKTEHVPLAQLEQPAFHDKLQRAQNAGGYIVANALQAGVHMGSSAIALAGYLSLCALIHPLLPLLVAAAGAVLIAVKVRGGVGIWSIRWQNAERERRLDYLGGLAADRGLAPEVRLFGLARRLIESWWRFANQVRDEQFKAGARVERVATAIELVPHAVFALGLIVVLDGVAHAGLSIGDYVMLTGALRGAESSFGMLAGFLRGGTETILNCGDAYDYLTMAEAADPQGGAPFPGLRDRIRFEDVHFAYPGGTHKVLDGLDLEIRAGEKLALVGVNGAGKTTLIKLLLGLYQPDAGRITVDGVPLLAIAPDALRAACAAVFQDYARFELSARDNIGFGSLAVLHDDAHLLEAARLGGARELVERLPDGLDEVVGSWFGRGNLSGGEWQRLAISRAFARDARIMILDEPTASLDPLAEAEVYGRFAELAEGRTVVLISHRLGSARLASRIAVLGDGRIVETGTHAQLMAAGGPYARMFAAQSQWYQREAAGGV